jgi:hypothetical protein
MFSPQKEQEKPLMISLFLASSSISMRAQIYVADGAILTAQLGTPGERYDDYSSKSSLSMNSRFIKPVGERTNF